MGSSLYNIKHGYHRNNSLKLSKSFDCGGEYDNRPTIAKTADHCKHMFAVDSSNYIFAKPISAKSHVTFSSSKQVTAPTANWGLLSRGILHPMMVI